MTVTGTNYRGGKNTFKIILIHKGIIRSKLIEAGTNFKGAQKLFKSYTRFQLGKGLD